MKLIKLNPQHSYPIRLLETILSDLRNNSNESNTIEYAKRSSHNVYRQIIKSLVSKQFINIQLVDQFCIPKSKTGLILTNELHNYTFNAIM